MDRRALLSDTTGLFLRPCQPVAGDTVTIIIRTARDDAQRVEYIQRGNAPVCMLRAFSDTLFDWYEIQIEAGTETIRYHFAVTGKCSGSDSKAETVYYDTLGPSDGHDDDFDFTVIPGFYVPGWARGAVMYQIFPDRFCNGDPSNDVQDEEYIYMDRPVKHADWDEPVGESDYACFYGGDIRGICDKLDYLTGLGVEAVYLNPVFESPSSHGYDIRDYRHAAGHLGGDKALKMLCDMMHKRGMKIILDGVFNHTGIENDWVHSHPEYYKEAENGEPECWWDIKTLPKLNYDDSVELNREILDIASFWLQEPYCIDGWRLDVAADLGHSRKVNHAFWKSFRQAVRKVNPEAIIIAEHYGDPEEWLRGDEWDTVMNYDGFMDPVGVFFTGMEKHSDLRLEGRGDGRLLRLRLDRAYSRMSMQSVYSAMNELDNHDHSRFLTRTGNATGRLETLGSKAAEEGTDVSVLRQAVLMQMSLPGCPTIYYGDEAGLCGFTDPDNRRPYPWGNADEELIAYYCRLVQERRSRPELKTGSLVWLKEEQELVCYARITEDSRDIFIFHTGDEEKDIEIPVYPAGVRNDEPLRGVMYTDTYDYGFRGETVHAAGGSIRIKVKKNSGIWLS